MRLSRYSVSVIALLFRLRLAGQIVVPTAQYDNARTGANRQETILKPANVKAGQFGKLFSYRVEGDVYAQPLYVPALEIPGKGKHDVLFVATEHDSIYAFDAGGNPASPLWKAGFLNPAKGVTSVPGQATGCPFIEPEVGITPTPVIDVQTHTIYVLARTKEKTGSGDPQYWQRLHALDLTTGAEKPGGPAVIRGSVAAANGGLLGLMTGSVEFLSLHENPRAALLLSNGKIYLSWGSSCDIGPYHGWVMAYDSHTLRQTGVFNTSPETALSGIWQSDMGPASDENGNVYVATGNGVFDAAKGGRDYGDTLLKLRSATTGGLAVADYFTPFEEAELSRTDSDLGSGGPVLVPGRLPGSAPLVVIGGKGGTLYLIDSAHMGHFHAGRDASAVQTISIGNAIKSAPAFWNGHLYLIAGDDGLRDYALRNGRLALAGMGRERVREPGATPTISANGSKDGIVWFIETRVWDGADRAATLYAYEAANVAHQLYSSDTNRPQDGAGIARRFTIPTVANGRVYLGGSNQVDVYGLLPAGRHTPPVRGKENP